MKVENSAYLYKRWRRFGILCLCFYLVILIDVTLFTHNYYEYGRSFNIQPFDSIMLMWNSGNIHLMAKNIIGNVLLFVPGGFFLALLFPRCRRLFVMFAVGAASSLLIETAQYQYARRIFDVDDILLNVAGTLFGWLLFLVIRRIMKKAGA